MKIRERLQQLQMRTSELATYLEISRPTLYKYIELYDAGVRDGINKRVLKLLGYIDENKAIGKRGIIAYVASGRLNELDGILGEKQFCFYAKEGSTDFELLGLVQTYLNSAYDANNFGDKLGMLLLSIERMRCGDALSEQERKMVIKIIDKDSKNTTKRR
ncbi:MAG: hypothetical protein FWD76_01565 [Firmicutes bacterium]|nr:hypothetical protein [Bacillota bacterium]